MIARIEKTKMEVVEVIMIKNRKGAGLKRTGRRIC